MNLGIIRDRFGSFRLGFLEGMGIFWKKEVFQISWALRFFLFVHIAH